MAMTSPYTYNEFDPRNRRPIGDYALSDPTGPSDKYGYTNKDSLQNRGLIPGMADKAGMGGMLGPTSTPPPPNPQLLTPQNQQAVTRPRQVGMPLPPPPVNMPAPDTASVDAPNSGLPTGLNSVGQKLAEYGPHYAYGPAHVDEHGHQVGTVPGTSRKSHLEALGIADPTSTVTQTPEGWQIDPAHERGKGYGVVHGLLQGALQGVATTGKWQGALGGAATGGIAGGISPKLMQGLERNQETTREQTQYDRELSNQSKEQTLGVQRSQIEENLAQAEHARTGTPHYIQKDDGTWVAAYDNRAYPVTEGGPGGSAVKGKDPDAPTEYQKATLAESQRWHNMQNAKADRDKVDVVVGGKKYRVSSNTAARIAESQRTKDKTTSEASIRAAIEDDAEQDALTRRKETDTRIAELRGKRDKLTHRSVQNADGSWGWEEDMGAALTSKTSVAALDKEIADLLKESDNQQRIAETAAQNKRKAEAESKAGGQSPQWRQRGSDLNRPVKGRPAGARRGSGKAFNIGAWATDHPGEDVNAKRKQLTDDGYTITE